MFDVITFGAATRDVFLRSKAMELHKEHGITEACFAFGAKLNVEEMAFETGGGATNNAVTFSRLAGFRVAAVTRIGRDASGDEIVSALRRDRIDTRFVERTAEEKTGYSTIILSGVAERTILTYRGATARLEPAKIPWNQIRAKLFYASGLNGDLDLLKHILDHAHKVGAKVFMNPGGGEFKQPKSRLMPLLKRLDFIVLNREEAAQLIGAPVGDLKRLVTGMRKIGDHAVITDGRAGAYAITPHDCLHADIIPAPRVNLTGAGDAFGSAYSAAILRHRDIRSALAIGTVNATGVVQHTGAKVGIVRGWPQPKEINKVKIKKIIL